MTQALVDELPAAAKATERTRVLPPLWRLALTPLALAVVLALLAWYVSEQEKDQIELRSLNADYLLSRTLTHLELTAVATVFILVIAIPLGVLLTRRWARPSPGPSSRSPASGRRCPRSA